MHQSTRHILFICLNFEYQPYFCIFPVNKYFNVIQKFYKI